MEMLKSEVKLLLLRNSQLENENLMLKQNEMQLNKHLFREKRLNKVLESIKVAQNEYISRLNHLIIDLTTDSADENTYNLLKQQITTCVKTCKTLQNEYEMCKQTLFAAKSATATSTATAPLPTTTTTTTTSQDQSQHRISLNASQAEQSEYDEFTNETVPNGSEFDEFDEMMDFAEEFDEDHQMPELDLVEPQVILEEEDDDDDPNGAGEQYLDAKDKEFMPKKIIPKSARKSFSFNPENSIQISPKKRRIKNREVKTSMKFGDKFRCNWKDCEFISSYKQNVERHFRVHTGERPFKCNFKGCTFSASQAGNLKVHQQRHGHQSPNGHKIRIKSPPNAVRSPTNTIKSPHVLKSPQNALKSPQNSLKSPHNVHKSPTNAMKSPQNALKSPPSAGKSPPNAVKTSPKKELKIESMVESKNAAIVIEEVASLADLTGR